MTTNDLRSAGAPPAGLRASDYASSKYYLPPVIPADDDADEHAVDAGQPAAYAPPVATVAPAAPVAPVAPVTQVAPVAPAAPVPPIAPARRSRRGSNPILGVGLVLVVLAAVAGGGYWMLNRHDDSPAAAPAGNRVSAATPSAAPTLKTVKTSGGYQVRLPQRHFTVRLPHRPTRRTVAVRSGSLSGSSLQLIDRASKSEVQWTRINAAIPTADQEPGLRSVITGLERGTGFGEISAHDVTFHGHAARLVALKSSSGVRYSALVAIYRPTHVLMIVAPTGRTFDLIKNSFTWPI